MLAVFRYNLIYYIKNIDEAVYLSSFYLIINVMLYFGLHDKATEIKQLLSISTAFSLFIICIQSSSNIYSRDAEAGVLEIYCQINNSIYLTVIYKLMANFCVVFLSVALMLPLIYGIANHPWSDFLHTLLGLGAGGFAMLILAHLAAAITAGVQRGRALLLLLVFPPMLPIFIFTSDYLQHSEALWQPSLLFLLAYSAFTLPILCLAAASAMRQG